MTEGPTQGPGDNAPSTIAPGLLDIAREADEHLRRRLLPCWLSMEDPCGGCWTSVDARGGIHEHAAITLVFSARMAWPFATAGGLYRDPACISGARRALDHLERFRDVCCGGFWAALDRAGAPIDRSKHVYVQAFALFALAAAAAAGDRDAGSAAFAQFETIEDRACRDHKGLYVESFDGHWNETTNADHALGDAPARRTADTHLHLIEAYLELLRATGDERVAQSLARLVDAFLGLFLSTDGRYTYQKLAAERLRSGSIIWPGHDIEASWLLDTAAGFVGDALATAGMRARALELARGAIASGMLTSGAWRERVAEAPTAPSRILWWAQAEAMPGLVALSLRWRGAEMAARAVSTWTFVRRLILDPATGDWRLRVMETGEPDRFAPRIVHWKDPYHQARACMEIAARVQRFAEGPPLAS